MSNCTATSSGWGKAGGGAFELYQSSSVTLVSSSVSSCTVTSPGGTVNGAAFYLYNGCSASLASSSVSSCTASSSGGQATGGAFSLNGQESNVLLISALVSSCSATSSGGQAVGGAFSLDVECSASLVSSSVSSCTATSLNGAAEGGAFSLDDECSASLVSSSVSSCTATSLNGAAEGGAFHLSASSSASFVSSSVSSCTATSSAGFVYGGAFRLYDSCSASLLSSSVSGCTAVSSNGTAFGGGFQLEGACSASLVSSSVSNCVATSFRDTSRGGSFYVLTSSVSLLNSSVLHAVVVGRHASGGCFSLHTGDLQLHATILSNCSVRAVQTGLIMTAQGGAIALFDASKGTLLSTTIEGCSATSATGAAFGGAIFVSDSQLYMQDRTTLRHNTASGTFSNTLGLEGEDARAEYFLPAPSGTWLPASTCRVNREPCQELPLSYNIQCKLIKEKCRTIAANITYVSTSAGDIRCPFSSIVQPCRWCAHFCPMGTRASYHK